MNPDYREDIKNAVKVLREGGVILYPTDTVWGIGCDARNSSAVARIFAIKRREDSKALITLAGSLAQLERTVDGIPEVAYDLIECADRPLTIVYDSARPGSGLAPALLAADGTIGVRLTTDDFCRDLCSALGAPIVSTSANISGEPTAATFAEISPVIISAADYVCSWRQTDTTATKPSMVMRLSADGQFKILRK